ncbi:hypothetical protein AKJ63_01265 [candidate division MSBL1 archaeon SCGC-AAA259D18]|uniref:Transposase IS4-like domain-containing protein n=1 Tax=candidate division MSBL1 archaeon SCGC-AAA259D18 TaxID=1698262 RepID=A0A133UBI6_9EURY|nr:hypothetical protein AKJ63_01265 [candidate division MSBL1 archaeon SCGC-AAA259D18]
MTDFSTLKTAVGDLKERFGIENLVFVADRGVISSRTWRIWRKLVRLHLFDQEEEGKLGGRRTAPEYRTRSKTTGRKRKTPTGEKRKNSPK